jgi:hypothetical protein
MKEFLIEFYKLSVPSASPEVVSGGYGWNPKDCKAPYTKRSICVPLKVSFSKQSTHY